MLSGDVGAIRLRRERLKHERPIDLGGGEQGSRTYRIDGAIVEFSLARIHHWFKIKEERSSISTIDSCQAPRGVSETS